MVKMVYLMVCVFYHHNKKFYYKLREIERDRDRERRNTRRTPGEEFWVVKDVTRCL